MAKKKSSFSKYLINFLNDHGSKIILGLVATGSFAVAFGEEKNSQSTSLPLTSSSPCLSQFYQQTPPYLVNENLQKDTYPLCFNDFNVMYSGISKTPLWIAEVLTPLRLSQKPPREDSFHEETRVPIEYRATLADYRGSGFDRGHMASYSDMPNKVSQYDSFSLANIVPQAPKNNRQVWHELEEATRAIVTKQKYDVYMVTGPTYSTKMLRTIGANKVIVPTAVFKAIYIPKTGVIGAYYAPNDNSMSVDVVSVCYLEEQLGINLFPQLTKEQKRNIYNLPLSANEVKVNQQIPYANWDSESQCAEDVSNGNLESLKKQFQSDESLKSVEITVKNEKTEKLEGEPNSLEAFFKKILNFILHLLR